MKHKYMLVAAMAALCNPAMLLAAPKPAPAAVSSAPVKTVAYPLTGTVVAVSATELTIKGGEGKDNRVYVMTPQTVIVNGEKPATLAEVKVGQKVGGRLEKATAGHDTVLKLNIGVKQEPQPKPKAK